MCLKAFEQVSTHRILLPRLVLQRSVVLDGLGPHEGSPGPNVGPSAARDANGGRPLVGDVVEKTLSLEREILFFYLVLES